MKKAIIYATYEDRIENRLTADRVGMEHVFSGPTVEISDGYHTMDELYDHRIALFIALCKFVDSIDLSEWGRVDKDVWRSKLHSDGSSFEGWFILGLNKEKGKQITYHIPIDRWDETNFAETLDKAPEFDGHTSADVINRLKNI